MSRDFVLGLQLDHKNLPCCVRFGARHGLSRQLQNLQYFVQIATSRKVAMVQSCCTLLIMPTC